jgi:hypothetical protein
MGVRAGRRADGRVGAPGWALLAPLICVVATAAAAHARACMCQVARLVSATPADHPDRQLLEQAGVRLAAAVRELAGKQAALRSRGQMLELRRLFPRDADLFAPAGRTLLRSGEVAQLKGSDRVARHLHLFSDVAVLRSAGRPVGGSCVRPGRPGGRSVGLVLGRPRAILCGWRC